MKIIQQVLFITLVIFLTIASSNYYFVNYGYKKPFVQRYKDGYTIGCLENGMGLSIVECQMRAEDNVSSND